MRILTTGLAGRQQPRSARRGGPDQPARSSTARPDVPALRRGNPILTQLASGGGKPVNTDSVPGPRLVVLIVRAGFEARCAGYPGLAPAVQDRPLVK